MSVEEITEDEFHREFNVNLLGTILATKEAVKHFGPNGGSVINISSIASAGEAKAAIYSGTKGAVDAITRGLAAELGPFAPQRSLKIAPKIEGADTPTVQAAACE